MGLSGVGGGAAENSFSGAFRVENHSPHDSAGHDNHACTVIHTGPATCRSLRREVIVWFQVDQGSAGMAYHPIPFHFQPC